MRDVIIEQGIDDGTGLMRVVLIALQFVNLCERQVQDPAATNKSQPLTMLLVINTVTVLLPIRGRQQALPFIETDRLCIDPYRLCQ